VSHIPSNGYVEREAAERYYRTQRAELQNLRERLVEAREEAWEQRQNCETALRFLAAYSEDGFRAYQREIA
jgi:hypothetical protein